jgi:hypothetical protein
VRVNHHQSKNNQKQQVRTILSSSSITIGMDFAKLDLAARALNVNPQDILGSGSVHLFLFFFMDREKV